METTYLKSPQCNVHQSQTRARVKKHKKISGLVIFHSAKWKIITKQPAPCHVLSKCVLTRATKEADYLLMNFTYQITSIFMAKSLDRARNVYMYLARSNIGRHMYTYIGPTTAYPNVCTYQCSQPLWASSPSAHNTVNVLDGGPWIIPARVRPFAV